MIFLTVIHKKVAAARKGENPAVITKLRSGWAILGDVQFLSGYSLLLPDPVVATLNDLSKKKRQIYLEDMTILGDALLKVTGAIRINYEILGNLEPALHAHLFPRYANENPALKTRPVWFYDWTQYEKFDKEKHRDLIVKIRKALSCN